VSDSVSVIVPSLTGDVSRLRASLDRQTHRPSEVIVVTNVRPAGRARNQGARQAHGELLLFVDDDAELGDDRVLERMVRAAEDRSVTVVGSSRILPPSATNLQRRIAFEVPRWEEPIADELISADPPLDRYGFSAATTTCCLIRRAAFEEVGGFDEELVTGEDPELFYRLRRAGHSFVIPANAWTFHAPPADFAVFLKKCFRYGMGHAQEARHDPARRMDLLPLDRPWSWIVVAAAPFLVLPMMFLDIRLQPTVSGRFAFRPIQAVARLATLAGYVRGWRGAHG
jgi:cellulose synthase/poly-beta-1,6-N-acetylglucosamine synthase-like glycosyltransferase